MKLDPTQVAAFIAMAKGLAWGIVPALPWAQWIAGPVAAVVLPMVWFHPKR